MLVSNTRKWQYRLTMSEQALNLESDTPDLDASVVAGDSLKNYLNEIGRTPLLTSEEEVSLSRLIEAGVFAGHLLHLQSQLSSAPEQISNEDKRLAEKYMPMGSDLQVIAADGQSAKTRMIQANLKLVVSIAKRHTGRGLDLIDVIQEGNLGLIHSVEKFDYTKGFKFSTYSSWWIRQAISRGLANTSRTIRLPHDISVKVSKYSRLSQQFFQDNGREATDQEIAELIGENLEKARFLKELNSSPLSLDRTIRTDTQITIGEKIEDKSVAQPEASTLDGMTYSKINEAIDRLDPQQALIIKLRYGIGNYDPKKLEEIGEEVGLKRESVRRHQLLAEDRLRFIFKQYGITGSTDG